MRFTNPTPTKPHSIIAIAVSLLIYTNLFATNYYVSTNGSSNNNGLSEENSWSLSYAFNQAQAGDVVYVKAGNYGDLNLQSKRSGTSTNPIKFIGYTSVPGDLSVGNEYSTYTYADFDANNAVLPSNIMPLIETNRGPDNDPGTNDKAMYITHDWIHIENFMAQYQNVSYQIKGANVTMINCYSNETGNWDPSNPGWNLAFSGPEPGGNLSGYGFYASSGGRNFTLKSSTVFNAGADAIFLVGADYHLGEYNSIYTDKSGNSTDYHYVLYDAQNATLNHNKAFRYQDRNTGGDLPHHSRGLAVKHTSSNCTINDYFVYNTRFVVYQESNNNSFTNVVIDATNEAFTGQLIIAGNSNNNTFLNTKIINGSIQFNDYNAEGYSFSGSGSDNYFINTIIEGVNNNTVDNAFINIGNSIWNGQNNPMIDAGTNYFLGGTFYNADYFIVQDRPLVEFVFKNILVGNVAKGFRDKNNSGSSNAGILTFENCNFDNTNFTTPSGTNITTFNPLFTDINNKDFTLTTSSPAIDTGNDTSAMHPLSSFDFLGVSRPQGNGCDVGAYEKKNESEVIANAGNDIAICEGTSTTLTATGGNTYLWSTGETTASIDVNPTSTTTYTVTVSDGTNSDTDDVIVTVNPLPTANAGSDISIYQGESTILTASGGDTYLWNTGETTTSITVNPTNTTTYSVTVTQNQCSDTSVVTVTVNNNPLPVANAGNDIAICEGTSTTLTATGGNTYLWSTGETTASIDVNPTSTTTFSVTVSDGVNSDTDNVIVTVNPLPTANAGSDISIYQGESTILTASGGDTYLWSTGETTASITVNPTNTTTYSVTVTQNQCSDTSVVTVTVNNNPLPVANAGNDIAICEGTSTTLTATGGNTYLWSTGETTASIDVNPTSTTTYTVTVSDGVNSDTDDVIVTVNPLPTANAGSDISIYQGESTILTASGGDTYLWSTGQTTASITVNPTSTTNYSVIVSQNQCSDTSEVIVTVNPLPQANAGNDETIFRGDSITLTATGGSTYLWSNGENTSSIIVSPEYTTRYEVTVFDGNYSDTDDVKISVISNIKSLGTNAYEKLNFNLYPNPTTNGIFHIDLPIIENNTTVSIYDITGKLILTREFNNQESLNLNPNLAIGIYMIKVFTGQKLGIKKLIVR